MTATKPDGLHGLVWSGNDSDAVSRPKPPFPAPIQAQIHGLIKGESATYDEDRMNNPWDKDPDKTGWLGRFYFFHPPRFFVSAPCMRGMLFGADVSSCRA